MASGGPHVTQQQRPADATAVRPRPWLRTDLQGSALDGIADGIGVPITLDERERCAQLAQSMYVAITDHRFAVRRSPARRRAVEVHGRGVEPVELHRVEQRGVLVHDTAQTRAQRGKEDGAQ